MSKFWSRSSSSSSSSSSCCSSSRSFSSACDDDIGSERLESPVNETSTVGGSGEDSGNAAGVDDPDVAWEKIQSEQVFMEMPATEQQMDRSFYTRVVCMSDTHAMHRSVRVPQGDVLIHGGDFTKSGEIGTVADLSAFFGELQFQEVICIAGNHDVTFQPEHYERVWEHFHGRAGSPFDAEAVRRGLKNCTYLEDESCTVHGGIEVYGSPWQPDFLSNWAFNLPRGEPLRAVWSKIPETTDILVTHGPPLGRGDCCSSGERAGCLDLLREVQNRVKPRLHIFGHIHAGYGVTSDGTTLFVNASNFNSAYEPHNPCVVVDLPHDRSLPPVLVKPVCTFTCDELVEWLRNRGYSNLLPYFEQVSGSIPEGNALLKPDTCDELVDLLLLHRDKDATEELRQALSQLYAESHDR